MLECSSTAKNRQSLWRLASWLLIKDVMKELLRVQEGIKKMGWVDFRSLY